MWSKNTQKSLIGMQVYLLLQTSVRLPQRWHHHRGPLLGLAVAAEVEADAVAGRRDEAHLVAARGLDLVLHRAQVELRDELRTERKGIFKNIFYSSNLVKLYFHDRRTMGIIFFNWWSHCLQRWLWKHFHQFTSKSTLIPFTNWWSKYMQIVSRLWTNP